MKTHDRTRRTTSAPSPSRQGRAVRLASGKINGPDLLTIRELAELFGVRRETLWAWRRRNGFPAGIAIGTTRRFPREAIETWLAARQAAPAPTGPR